MDNSPLATLPPELRNIIYEHVLRLPRPLTISPGRTRRSTLRYWNDPAQKHLLALLLTCRLISTEGSRFFYTTNSFILACTTLHLIVGISKFMAQIGPMNASAVRNIVVTADWDINCPQRFVLEPLHRIVHATREEARKFPSCAFAIQIRFDYGPPSLNISFDVRTAVVALRQERDWLREDREALTHNWDRHLRYRLCLNLTAKILEEMAREAELKDDLNKTPTSRPSTGQLRLPTRA